MKPRVLQIDWKRPAVRKVAALLVFAVAFLVQYFLANMPLQVDVAVAAKGKLSAATIEPGQQRLVIEGPVVEPSQGRLFSHRGSAGEMIDVYFDKAQLSSDTLDMLRGQHIDPPTGWHPMRYITEGDEAQAVQRKCRPEFEIKLQENSSPPAEIDLFQSQPLGVEPDPYFELKVIGQQLAVRAIAFPGDDAKECGYRKVLKAGDWEQLISPSVGVRIITAAGSGMRVYFRPNVSSPSSENSGRITLALVLGSAPDKLEDAPPFRARAVRIEPLSGSSVGSPAILSASTGRDDPPLTLYKLGVSSDNLLIGVSGRGKVKENGKEETFDGLDWVKRSPPLEVLLGTANTGLGTWIISIFVRRRKAKPPSSHAK
jgi:hypothetical protein